MLLVLGITAQHWTNKFNTGYKRGRGGGGGDGTSSSGWERGANRQCPFYKKMPGMSKIICTRSRNNKMKVEF